MKLYIEHTIEKLNMNPGDFLELNIHWLDKAGNIESPTKIFILIPARGKPELTINGKVKGRSEAPDA